MCSKNKKSRFREVCLSQLRAASGYGAYIKDKRVQQRLYKLIRDENASRIMLYLPLKTEVDLYPLIRKLRREKRLLYVPFMEGASFRLVKYRYPLRTKRFGIKEPNDSRQYRSREIDLAIVPIVGVDAALRRIGFGKGMYDRFFEKEIENIKKVVFVARAFCYTGDRITDDHDIGADIVVVP